MTTKERILFESLELFSNKGFEATSMRDIGRAVEIRESSIYKHYAGKQAILDAIVDGAMEEVDKMFVELNVPDQNSDSAIARYSKMEIEDVAELCTSIMLKQRRNTFVSKFRRLLTIEQYQNEELKKLYIEVFMNRQLEYNEKVFAYLLQAGILQGETPKMMALQFYAPFFLLQYKLPDDEQMLEMELKQYVMSFLRTHLKGENEK